MGDNSTMDYGQFDFGDLSGDAGAGADAGQPDPYAGPDMSSSFGDSADADFATFMQSGQVPGNGSSSMDLSNFNLSDLGLPGLPNLGTQPAVDHSAVPVGYTPPAARQASMSLVPAVGRGAVQLARIAGVIISAVGVGGLATFASALGLDAGKLLQAWVRGKTKRRRGRGITGRQLTTTRRTLRVVTGMYHSLQKLAPHSTHRAAAHPFRKRK